MTNDEIILKLSANEEEQNVNDEEELIEESSNEEKEQTEKEEHEIDMEEEFYKNTEKTQDKGYQLGIRLNLHRTRIIDDNVEMQRTIEQQERENIKQHIRELLLKKRNPERTLELIKNPENF